MLSVGYEVSPFTSTHSEPIGDCSAAEHIFINRRLLFSHIRRINRIVQSKFHRSVTNSFSNNEAPRTSSWCILWVEFSTAVSNWLRMRWCERWDFISNAEHIFVNRRLLFSHIRCINRIVQSKVHRSVINNCHDNIILLCFNTSTVFCATTSLVSTNIYN